MNRKALYIISAGVVMIGILAVVLYIKMPSIYYIVSDGMTEEEYYRTSYEQEWDISLPPSRVMARKSVNVGYDGGGTVYTVLTIRETGWRCTDAIQSQSSQIEAAFTEMMEEICSTRKEGETLPRPDFSQDYEWRYLEKEITGTGANGTKVTILIHSLEEDIVYYVESLK